MFTERLHQLRRELADDSKATVIGLTDPTMDALDATRVREATYDKLAQNVQANATDEDVRTATDEYLQAVTRAEDKRATAIQAVIGYLGDDVAGADAVTAVNSAIEVEGRLASSIDNLSVVKHTVSVPAILAITGPETLEAPKGTEVSETYVLSNLGTEPATEITASVDTDLSLSVSSTRLGDLEPDAEATVTLVGTPTTEGIHSVKLSATTGSIGDVLVVTAVVADKVDYLNRVVVQVDALQKTVAGIRTDGWEFGRDMGRHDRGEGRGSRARRWNDRERGRSGWNDNDRWSERGGKERWRDDWNRDRDREDGDRNEHDGGRNIKGEDREHEEQGSHDQKRDRHERGRRRDGRDRGRNGLDGVENKFRIVEKRLKRLVKRLEHGRGRSVDNRIGAVVHTLEAAENQIEALQPQQISPGDARLVTNDIEATVMTLHIAQDAEP